MKNIRKRRGETLRVVAEAIGVSVNTVWRWEAGQQNPSDEMKRRLSSHFGVSISYLLGETDEPGPILARVGQGNDERCEGAAMELPSAEDWVMLPVLDPASFARTDCGVGGISNIYRGAGKTVMLPRAYVGNISLERDKRPFLVIARGDSMDEANIPDGAEVVINPAETIRDGDPALVCYGSDGDWGIKWVYWHRNDTVELRAASLKYPPKIFTREDMEQGLFYPVGKVVRVTTVPKRGG